MSGDLYIIAAPSGAGKTSLVNALVAHFDCLQVSVSHTTRVQRPGEIDGTSYNFVDELEFLELIKQEKFLEHALVFGHHYGTSKQWVSDKLAQNCDVILEIDWQGARLVKSLFPKSIQIYILPPSMPQLEERLRRRAQDNATVIAGRMAQAKNELQHIDNSDYIVVNDDFDRALQDLISIVRASRLRHDRQMMVQAILLKELGVTSR